MILKILKDIKLKKTMEKFFKNCIALSSFFISSKYVKADLKLLYSSPSFYSFTSSNSINAGIHKYRKSEKIWGEIGKVDEIDLSEWGGKAPTCTETPDFRVYIK